jgi:hypothetical protein
VPVVAWSDYRHCRARKDVEQPTGASRRRAVCDRPDTFGHSKLVWYERPIDRLPVGGCWLFTSNSSNSTQQDEYGDAEFGPQWLA